MADARSGILVAGRVGRPHGLDGSFYVTQARPTLLQEDAEVTVSPPGTRTRITRRAGTDARPIVRVEFAVDRDAAAALRGRELLVDASAAPQLDADEYWAEQLVGARVRCGDLEVGVVTALLALPSCECLEVERDAASPLLVPMVRDAIRSIDAERGMIEIDLEFLGERKESDAESGATP